MARIAVYFGSTTGTCEELAGKIGSALAGAEIRNVIELDNSAEAYDMLGGTVICRMIGIQVLKLLKN